ncbi:hypothetical protein Plim_0455 [Planctopirus limnophila DSM 3776]|uniref:NolW-like domain-containing protein n=1 Tax=Planctopirus limnophila (strain ATCC 43296 / DSM 3776 / IFAM 1008 / Mu 290) TaxID=521674 RepID=D5SPS5_PLAL2|nr:hypothetical protein [Planctopirus limnophila]ADG66305.1 hypothetical protein Plim_0455 [Planctopirus limnophila DSM 3776]
MLLKRSVTALFAICLTWLAAFPSLLMAQETDAPAESQVAVEDRVIAEVQLEGVRLSEAIEHLKEVYPGFQAIVITKSNVPATDPVLPNIALKNVKLRNILRLLEISVPGLAYETIDDGEGNSDRITMFRVDYTEDAPENVLKIFSLRTILSRSDDRRAALDETLSLLQATLEAIGESNSVSMKVHEGTETVLIRGTLEQVAAIEEAIIALTPTAEELEMANAAESSQAELEKMAAQIHQLSEALPRIVSVMEKLKQTSEATSSELAAMQKRLDALEKSAAAK